MELAFVSEPETPAQPGPEPSWNESQALWWYDVASGAGGFVRLAARPNLGVGQIWCGVSLPGGRRFRRWSDQVALAGSVHATGWRVEDLTIRKVEAREVYYSAGGCELALTFADFHPPLDAFGLAGQSADAEVAEYAGAGHAEASGVVTGRVCLGDQEVIVSGLGHRDHSWGPRSGISGIRSARWFSGTTGSDLSFSVISVALAQGAVKQSGYVTRGDKLMRVDRFDVVTLTEWDGVSHREARGNLVLADGSELDIRLTDPVDGWVFGAEEYLCYEAPGRMSVDGVVGAANCEVSNNPFGGTSMPSVTARACVEDGLTHR